MEMVSLEGGKMIFVDVGGSWEERERRVREALFHLSSGGVAWMAPKNRSRILFSHSVQHYYKIHIMEEANLGVGNCIVGIWVCVDEEGRSRIDLDQLQFTLPNLETPPLSIFDYGNIFDQLLSPILDTIEFLC